VGLSRQTVGKKAGNYAPWVEGGTGKEKKLLMIWKKRRKPDNWENS